MAFQAEGLVQRAKTSMHCIGRQPITVHKLLRSLGLENRATMAFQAEGLRRNISSNVQKLVRIALVDNQLRFTSCFARSVWKTERLWGSPSRGTQAEYIVKCAKTSMHCVGRQPIAVYKLLRSLGLENRATMAFQAEGLVQCAKTSMHCVGRQPITVHKLLRSLGLESRATMAATMAFYHFFLLAMIGSGPMGAC